MVTKLGVWISSGCLNCNKNWKVKGEKENFTFVSYLLYIDVNNIYMWKVMSLVIFYRQWNWCSKRLNNHRHPSIWWQSASEAIFQPSFYVPGHHFTCHHLPFTTTMKGRYSRSYFRLPVEKTKFQMVYYLPKIKWIDQKYYSPDFFVQYSCHNTVFSVLAIKLKFLK